MSEFKHDRKLRIAANSKIWTINNNLKMGTEKQFLRRVKIKLAMSLINLWAFYSKLANLGIKRPQFFTLCIRAFLQDDPHFMEFIKEYILKNSNMYKESIDKQMRDEELWSLSNTKVYTDEDAEKGYEHIITLTEEEVLEGHERMCKELYYDGESDDERAL